jgi:hypothetical protein
MQLGDHVDDNLGGVNVRTNTDDSSILALPPGVLRGDGGAQTNECEECEEDKRK